MKLARTLAALVLFGISFGYVEAAVVVYLRTIFEPAREQTLAQVRHDEVFPLLMSSQTLYDSPRYAIVVRTELGRELATLFMLAAVGLMLGGGFARWLAGFMIAFAFWDIFYYVFLRLLIDWPASLWTWDILFLLPLPWVGPVITPLIVSLMMIGGGTIILWRESRGWPIPFRWPHWTGIVGGGLTIILAFCWDYKHIQAGGMPTSFPLAAVPGRRGRGRRQLSQSLYRNGSVAQPSWLFRDRLEACATRFGQAGSLFYTFWDRLEACATRFGIGSQRGVDASWYSSMSGRYSSVSMSVKERNSARNASAMTKIRAWNGLSYRRCMK